MLVTCDTNYRRNMEFQDLRLFVSVVDNGSFTRAAEQEDLPTSTLSRRLRKLEDELGLRLLERTTRSVQVTELGEEFYERCLSIIEEVDSTRASLQRKQDSPGGRLRIYAPTEFTRVHFEDIIPSFAEHFPDITLELFTTDGGHNLVDTRIDVMIHIEEPQDSSYIGKKLTVATTNYYASTKYLERFGEPQSPGDLEQHECILEAYNPHGYNRWLFPDEDQTLEVPVHGRYVTDSTYMALRLMERGLGVSMLPDYICREGLEAGRLQKLFGGRYEISHNIYLLYPSRRYVPSKVRVFLDFLEEKFPKQL
jgi:DNA-binding transcriptional LysR family regulator